MNLRLTTRTSTQMQLLTARLQLQEQRIAVLSNQHQVVSAKLMEESRLRAEADTRIHNMETTDARNLPAQLPRAEFDSVLSDLRRTASQYHDSEQQLRAAEAQLAGEIANEQNRWQDFNNRLDELERTLR